MALAGGQGAVVPGIGVAVVVLVAALPVAPVSALPIRQALLMAPLSPTAGEEEIGRKLEIPSCFFCPLKSVQQATGDEHRHNGCKKKIRVCLT